MTKVTQKVLPGVQIYRVVVISSETAKALSRGFRYGLRLSHLAVDCDDKTSGESEQLDSMPRADTNTTALSTEQRSGSNTSAGSTEISIDSDMLSISDTPSNYGSRRLLERHDNLSLVIDIIAYRLYQTFLSLVNGPVAASSPCHTRDMQLAGIMEFGPPADGDAGSAQNGLSPGPGPPSGSTAESISKTGASTAQSLKRPRGNDQDEDGNRDGGKRPRRPVTVRMKDPSDTGNVSRVN
ncbi:hypothetical protein B0T21DRAFT_351822 [Apiosordaria backusii]|uniref:Uncharacterized protein n=1 Tax=Apiosordaria backusii TaxID=314023 RepID=A0AA40DZT3_9PEZI|nr:hypothetical protein B0T21DRAFT_351822 [Apiosordaria backusii]